METSEIWTIFLPGGLPKASLTFLDNLWHLQVVFELDAVRFATKTLSFGGVRNVVVNSLRQFLTTSFQSTENATLHATYLMGLPLQKCLQKRA